MSTQTCVHPEAVTGGVIPGYAVAPSLVKAIPREIALSRLLMAFTGVGVLFMLLPGTFLGLWNLLTISSRHAASAVTSGWAQAHGHAQVFGWVGTFILGVGLYALPKMRNALPFPLWQGWTTLALWTAGVGLRWAAVFFEWQWRALLPLSAVLELAAVGLFLGAVWRPRLRPVYGDAWIVPVFTGTAGLALVMTFNLLESARLALAGASPVFLPEINTALLVLCTWGFLVPVVWGFSARWLPTFAGTRTSNSRALKTAVGLNSAGLLLTIFRWTPAATALFLFAAVAAVLALRVLEPAERAAKTRGAHVSYPWFIRLAYLWLLVSGVLAWWAVFADTSGGIWGASRHALTVGFIGTMVLSVGQRVLPAFSGMRHLYSPRLMFASLALLSAGCAVRVTAEVLAYQGYSAGAWQWLPVSAGVEMTAITLFAVNIVASFARPGPPVVKPMSTAA